MAVAARGLNGLAQVRRSMPRSVWRVGARCKVAVERLADYAGRGKIEVTGRVRITLPGRCSTVNNEVPGPRAFSGRQRGSTRLHGRRRTRLVDNDGRAQGFAANIQASSGKQIPWARRHAAQQPSRRIASRGTATNHHDGCLGSSHPERRESRRATMPLVESLAGPRIRDAGRALLIGGRRRAAVSSAPARARASPRRTSVHRQGCRTSSRPLRSISSTPRATSGCAMFRPGSSVSTRSTPASPARTCTRSAGPPAARRCSALPFDYARMTATMHLGRRHVRDVHANPGHPSADRSGIRGSAGDCHNAGRSFV